MLELLTAAVVVVELGRELRGAISDVVVESSRGTTATATATLLLRPADNGWRAGRAGTEETTEELAAQGSKETSLAASGNSISSTTGHQQSLSLLL